MRQGLRGFTDQRFLAAMGVVLVRIGGQADG